MGKVTVELNVHLSITELNADSEVFVSYKKAIHDNCKYMDSGDYIIVEGLEHIPLQVSRKSISNKYGYFYIDSYFNCDDYNEDKTTAIDLFEQAGFAEMPK